MKTNVTVDAAIGFAANLSAPERIEKGGDTYRFTDPSEVKARYRKVG